GPAGVGGYCRRREGRGQQVSNRQTAVGSSAEGRRRRAEIRGQEGESGGREAERSEKGEFCQIAWIHSPHRGVRVPRVRLRTRAPDQRAARVRGRARGTQR